MKSYKTILLLPWLAVLSNPVMAHHAHDGYTKFEQRIERQHKRIKKGVRNDSLTKKEAKKLRKQHRYIKRLNRYFQNDGHLSRYERETLQRELDLASKRIYRLKHNERYRNNASLDQGQNKKSPNGNPIRYRDNDHTVMLEYWNED